MPEFKCGVCSDTRPHGHSIEEIRAATSARPKRGRGRPRTGQKTPWKDLNISKATYYRRVRDL